MTLPKPRWEPGKAGRTPAKRKPGTKWYSFRIRVLAWNREHAVSILHRRRIPAPTVQVEE